MKTSDPIQQNVLAFAAQMLTFSENIPTYAAVLKLDADDVASQLADANYYDYIAKVQVIMQSAARQATWWRDLIRDGGTPPPTGAPGPLVLPKAVPPVPPGVEARFRALVQHCKSQANYNVAMGAILGIEGAQQVPPDYATLQPVLTLSINGNRVEVGWGWSGYSAYLDLCELQVDRGDGKGMVPLAFDPTPGYIDTQTFPTAPAKWTYQGIYRVGDAQVGMWSNAVSITVPG